jgi:hypothetical protein
VRQFCRTAKPPDTKPSPEKRFLLDMYLPGDLRALGYKVNRRWARQGELRSKRGSSGGEGALGYKVNRRQAREGALGYKVNRRQAREGALGYKVNRGWARERVPWGTR